MKGQKNGNPLRFLDFFKHYQSHFFHCEATNSVIKPTDVLDIFLFRKKWCKFKIKTTINQKAFLMTGADKSTSIRSRIGNIVGYKLHKEIKRSKTMFTYILKYILANNVLIECFLLWIFKKRRIKKIENCISNHDQNGAILE